MQPAAATGPGRVLLPLFFLALIPPSYFYVAGLRLDPMRVLMMLAFVPLLLRLLGGAAGRLRAMDALMALFGAWMVLTYVWHHGMERFPFAMITMVELLGGYLIGRVAIRSAASFRRLFILALWVMIFLAPFVLVELLTDRNILQEISRSVLPTHFKGGSSYGRMGLNRVMAGFEHPILYGLFCSVTLSVLLAMAWGHQLRRLLVTGFVTFMTFASLSSAPLLSVAVQAGLLIWGRLTGARWKLLLGLTAAAYVTVDMLSNRTPVTILINYITFDPSTAWTRILIWDFGSAEMWRHPVFGIGLNDWSRPYWLTGSVDNFWLLMGMRHGVVGLGLLVLGLVSGLWGVLRARLDDPEEQRLRTAYVITMVGLCFTLTTVHVWGGTSCLAFLLFGAGQWFRDRPPGVAPEARSAEAVAPAPRRPAAQPLPAGARSPHSHALPEPLPPAPGREGPRYSRFPPRQRRGADDPQSSPE